MWGFARRSPRSLEVTPKHEELFRDAETLAESVTRETSQNSADAKTGTHGVRVRIVRVAVPLDRFKERWLGGLEAHMEAWRPGFAQAAFDNPAEVECLVVEDFGTNGLDGHTDQPGGGFFSFWRQYGKSHKSGDTGGRHGEGKSTLAGASRARAFFGLTVRDEDGRRLLMGQAIFGPHEIGSDKFEAYGEFSPTQGDELPAPFEDDETVAAFAEDFKLARRDEPGLSLVVPAVRNEIVEDDLAPVKRALVANCFPQVASGLLTFDLEGDLLDRSTLADWARRFEPELRLSGAVAVALEACAPARVFAAREGKTLDADSFDPADADEMRRAFADGRLVSVRVPVAIKLIGGANTTGAMLLHLRRAAPDEAPSEHYARSRLTVPRQPKVLAGRDAIGLLIAEDGPLSDFLGDAEPPSHARWTLQNLRDVARYRQPQPTLSRVASALRQLERVLRDEEAESVNRDAFKALFSRPLPRPSREDDRARPQPADLPPARPFWKFESRPGGFTAIRPDGVEIEDVVIEVAYAKRRGAPDWKDTDFVLGRDIAVESDGEGEIVASRNLIEVTGAEPGLRIDAQGFDPHRDLVVLVRAKETGDE